MTTANLITEFDTPTESPTKTEDICDLDFVVIDEVDNSKHNGSLPTETLEESMAESTTLQTREYHRREKKDLALSLLDDFAWQSGLVRKTSGSVSEKLPHGSALKSPRSVSCIVASSTLSKSKTSDHPAEISTESDSSVTLAPSSIDTVSCEGSSSGSGSSISQRNLFIDIEASSEEVMTKSVLNDKKAKLISPSETTRHSDSSDETSLPEQNEEKDNSSDKKRRPGMKSLNKNVVAKNKSPSSKDVNCNDQMLSICLPGYNWLEKKICDTPKEEQTEHNESDSCILVAETHKSTSDNDFEISKSTKNKERSLSGSKYNADKVSLSKTPITTEADAMNNNHDKSNTKIDAIEIPDDDSITHWSECVIVDNESLQDDSSLCHFDEEPILLPTIEDAHADSNNFQSNVVSCGGTKLEESRVTADDSAQDDLILISVTTCEDSSELQSGYNTRTYSSEKNAPILSSEDGNEAMFNLQRTIEDKSITDETENADNTLKWRHSGDKGLPLSEILVQPKKKAFLVEDEKSFGHGTPGSKTFDTKVELSVMDQSLSLESEEDDKAPKVYETCQLLYQKIQSIVSKTDASERSTLSQRPSETRRGMVNRSLQDAIHAAMVRAIWDDSTDEVTSAQKEETPDSCKKGKFQDEINNTTDESCPVVRGNLPTSQTHLPPKKRLLSIDKSEESNASNRSPPLSKRRKTFSRVQKVRPIVLTEGEEEKYHRPPPKGDPQNSIVIEEDSDDNSSVCPSSTHSGQYVISAEPTQSLCLQKSIASPTVSQFGSFPSKLKTDNCPASDPREPEHRIIETKSPSGTNHQPTAPSGKAKLKKKKVLRKPSRPIPTVNHDVPFKEKTTYDPSRTSPFEYFPSDPSSSSCIQLNDGTVAFNEIRALQPPLHSSEVHSTERLRSRHLGPRREFLQKQMHLEPSNNPPSNMVESSKILWPPIYDGEKGPDQPNDMLKALTDTRPMSSAFSTPFTCAIPIQSRASGIVNKEARLSPVRQNSMFQWVSNPNVMTAKCNTIRSDVDSVSKSNSVTGHAFYPVTPSYKPGGNHPVIQTSPSTLPIQPSVSLAPSYLPGQFLKPVDASKAITPRPMPPPNANFLGHQLPQRASPQVTPLMMDPYIMPIVNSGNHASVSQPNLAASTSGWYPLPSSRAHLGAVPCQQTLLSYTQTKISTSPMQKDLITGPHHDPRPAYMHRPPEPFGQSVPMLDSRFSSSLVCQPTAQLYSNHLANANTANSYWNPSRVASLPTAAQNDIKN